MSFPSPDPYQYRGRGWSVDIVPKPWYIDLAIIAVVVAWMTGTFWMIQQFGPSLELLVPAVIIGLVGILLVYGQRLTYLQLGDTLVVRLRSPNAQDTQTQPTTRQTEPEDDD